MRGCPLTLLRLTLYATTMTSAEASSAPHKGWHATAGKRNRCCLTRCSKCVRTAPKEAGLASADEGPRLLRNTYGRRHILAGKANERVSNLMGLYSHRTATRLRQRFDADEMSIAQA